MADIELVIKIPKYIYDTVIASDGYIADCDNEKVGMAVKKGIPLPKGHGRLIILSEDEVKRKQTHLNLSCQNWISEIGLSEATVAIIEADKTESKESGVKEVTLELLTKFLINDFLDYQKECLTSHNDIEFDRPEEGLILAFLDDTAESYISEHIS